MHIATDGTGSHCWAGRCRGAASLPSAWPPGRGLRHPPAASRGHQAALERQGLYCAPRSMGAGGMRRLAKDSACSNGPKPSRLLFQLSSQRPLFAEVTLQRPRSPSARTTLRRINPPQSLLSLIQMRVPTPLWVGRGVSGERDDSLLRTVAATEFGG